MKAPRQVLGVLLSAPAGCHIDFLLQFPRQSRRKHWGLRLHRVEQRGDDRSGDAVWSDATRELWQRIVQHDFEPKTLLNFTQRLARDYGWSLSEARAAIEEYRRFCFLAVVSETPVTPSEEIDAVWHHHLIYSRDYWSVWCSEVLKMPLHHDPTPGGPDAQILYRRQYAQTLVLYETYFGASGADMWPASHIRFGNSRFRMIDRRRWFAVRNPLSWLHERLSKWI